MTLDEASGGLAAEQGMAVPGDGLQPSCHGDDADQAGLGHPRAAHPRELMVNAFVTLDGVMQAPGGPEEDPTGGFAHGGWSVNSWDESSEPMSTITDPKQRRI